MFRAHPPDSCPIAARVGPWGRRSWEFSGETVKSPGTGRHRSRANPSALLACWSSPCPRGKAAGARGYALSAPAGPGDPRPPVMAAIRPAPSPWIRSLTMTVMGNPRRWCAGPGTSGGLGSRSKAVWRFTTPCTGSVDEVAPLARSPDQAARWERAHRRRKHRAGSLGSHPPTTPHPRRDRAQSRPVPTIRSWPPDGVCWLSHPPDSLPPARPRPPACAAGASRRGSATEPDACRRAAVSTGRTNISGKPLSHRLFRAEARHNWVP